LFNAKTQLYLLGTRLSRGIEKRTLFLRRKDALVKWESCPDVRSQFQELIDKALLVAKVGELSEEG
jgi:hypothetical protein